jgi:uncharacterized protein involved in exopolysaccharide biosynthesis
MEHKSIFKEIDIMGLAAKVWSEKKLLCGFVVCFAVIGVVYALNQQKTYTAEVRLAPEASSMGMSSSISDIAGMMGLNVSSGGNSVDAIYPEIYPEVFASSDFIVKLFNIPVTDKTGQHTKSYYNHLLQDTKAPFWNYPKYWLIKAFSKKKHVAHGYAKLDPRRLTKEQSDVCNAIRGLISCQQQKLNNVITISAIDTDPCIAAEIADTIQRRLQEYITFYRTHKARIDLENARKICAEAKADYVRATRRYAGYSDANQDLVLESYKTTQEDLENEMQLRFNIYQQTTQQVQQASARVQENTPAFTVIQSAVVPMEPSSTPRYYMVLGFMVLGVVADVIWVLLLRAPLAGTRLGKKLGLKH